MSFKGAKVKIARIRLKNSVAVDKVIFLYSIFVVLTEVLSQELLIMSIPLSKSSICFSQF